MKRAPLWRSEYEGRTSDMLPDRIVLNNDLNELRRMTQWLRTSAASAGIADALVQKLDLAANEAVTNIISYAYSDAARHDITLDLEKTGGGARLTICDDGAPFNILEVPEHAVPASLESAAIGGLGVHLIRGLTSRCEYRRENGKNVLTLETERELQTGNA